MSLVQFFAAGLPKGQPRPRAFAFHGKARVFDPGTAEGWKSQVALAAKDHMPPEPLAGPLWVDLTFYFPRPGAHYRGKAKVRREDAPQFHVAKPDADNAAKAVLDALTTLGVWKDDAQVCSLSVTKRYADVQSGCAIKIEPA